jgi:hypothetical protein
MTATARQKIEELTNSWYGYAVFGAILSIWNNGIGFFSLIGTAFSFVFSIFLTWFIGRRLMAKSTLTRLILVIVTALSSLFGSLGVAKLGVTFFQTFSLSILVYAMVSAVVVYMNIKSFRVLTDKSVKAYFG